MFLKNELFAGYILYILLKNKCIDKTIIKNCVVLHEKKDNTYYLEICNKNINIKQILDVIISNLINYFDIEYVDINYKILGNWAFLDVDNKIEFQLLKF